MARDGPLHPTALDVARALSLCPGAGPAQLVSVTGRGWGSIQHAVHALRSRGLLREIKHGRSRAYFLVGQYAPPGLLLRGAPLRLYEAICQHPGADASLLAAATGLGATDVSRLAAQLAEEGFIERVRLDRHVHFLPARANRPQRASVAPQPNRSWNNGLT